MKLKRSNLSKLRLLGLKGLIVAVLARSLIQAIKAHLYSFVLLFCPSNLTSVIFPTASTRHNCCFFICSSTLSFFVFVIQFPCRYNEQLFYKGLILTTCSTNIIICITNTKWHWNCNTQLNRQNFGKYCVVLRVNTDKNSISFTISLFSNVLKTIMLRLLYMIRVFKTT